MQIFETEGTERNQVIELVLEDIAGGGVIEKSDFPTSSTGMKEGALLGVASDGIYHIIKTAMVVNALATNDTHMVVYNNHEFKVGDYIGNTVALATGAAVASGVAITAIAASGAGKDVITATWSGPAVAASGLITAVSGLGRAPFKYTPVAIATNPVDLANENNGCGLLVRGRVRQNLMPYYVDTALKALFPLIRFV
jgi:hypothetical protein